MVQGPETAELMPEPISAIPARMKVFVCIGFSLFRNNPGGGMPLRLPQICTSTPTGPSAFRDEKGQRDLAARYQCLEIGGGSSCITGSCDPERSAIRRAGLRK